MRNISFRPNDHRDILGDMLQKPKLLPSISDLTPIKAESIGSAPVELGPSLDSDAVMRIPSNINNLTAKTDNTSHMINKLYFSQISDLQQRILESEKNQKLVLQDMSKLQMNLSDSIKNQKNGIEEEYRASSHLRFLRDIALNLQNQIMSLAYNQSQGSISMGQMVEMMRRKDEDFLNQLSTLQSRTEENRNMCHSFLEEMISFRKEFSQMKTLIEQRSEENKKEFRVATCDIESTKAAIKSIQDSVNTLQVYAYGIDQKFSGSSKEADNNLLKVSKVLFDYSNMAKIFEDNQRERLRTEFDDRLQKSIEHLNAEKDKKIQDIREKYEFLSQQSQNQKPPVAENLEISEIKTKLSDLDANLHAIFKEFRNSKLFENNEIVRTIQILKNSILVRKKREQEIETNLLTLLENSRQEFRQQIDQISSKIIDMTTKKKRQHSFSQ